MERNNSYSIQLLFVQIEHFRLSIKIYNGNCKMAALVMLSAGRYLLLCRLEICIAFQCILGRILAFLEEGVVVLLEIFKDLVCKFGKVWICFTFCFFYVGNIIIIFYFLCFFFLYFYYKYFKIKDTLIF